MNDNNVNLVITASDQSGGTVKNAATNFSNLWEQIAKGKIAADLAQKGFDIIVGSIGNAIKTAADFQTSLVRLQTSAGETKRNLALVGKGIDQIAVSTGTTLEQLTSGMYRVESGGYHGADGLKILKAAAEGAKTEGADLTTVSDALTSAMRDYHAPASSAADITSKMVTAVGQGKMTFQEMASSLHSVLPLASAMHEPLSDILGMLASMTVHGESADQSTQNLAQALRKMQTPTVAMTNELAALGIRSSDLGDMLGTKGLSGTLEMISEKILSTSKNGKLLIDAFNGNKVMASDAMRMIAAMPPTLHSLAQAYTNGAISLKDFHNEVKYLPAPQANLMNQFAALSNRAHGFSGALKAGINTSQSYAQAIQAATGDATTMNVALMTTGENANYTKDAVKAVGAAHAEAGGHVKGWSEIQGTFNQQLSIFKERIQVAEQEIGSKLLPILTELFKSTATIVPIISSIADKVFVFLEPSFKALWKTIKNDLLPALGNLWKQVIEPLIPVVGAALAGAIWLATNALNILLQIITPVMNFISAHKQLVIDFGLAFVALALYMKFDSITSAFTSNMNTIMGSISNVKGGVVSLFTKISGGTAMGGIATAGAMADIALVTQAVQTVIGAINAMNKAQSAQVSAADQGAAIQDLAAKYKAGKLTKVQETNAINALLQGVDSAVAQSNHRATGGPVSANTSYIVGEHGKELFIPSSSGSIVPAQQTKQIMNNQQTSTQSVNIHQLVLPNVTNSTDFFKALNQDSMNIGKGLTPVQGSY